MDRRQQLLAEIAQLENRYSNLSSSDEFCYLSDQLRILEEQRGKLLLRFRITRAFLDGWNRFIKKPRNELYAVSSVARLRTNKFFATLKKNFGQSPELVMGIFDRYFQALDTSEEYMRQLVQSDLRAINEGIESTGHKHSALVESFQAARRELKKVIEAKQKELQLLSANPSPAPATELRQPVEVVKLSPSAPHRRRKKKQEAQEKFSPKKEDSWQFFLEGTTNPLPKGRMKFLAEINRVTQKELPRFKAGQLYSWVMAIAHQMTIGERETRFQKIDDPGGPYDSWKDLPIGDYHAFLHIDDGNQTIVIKLADRSVFKDIYRRR